MSLYSGKCIWCILWLSNYDFVLYCDYANWYLCIMDLCIMEYTMHMLHIHDMDMLITVCICYGVFWKSVIALHMDFRIWRNIGLVCYGTVLIVYCVTRYNDDKLVWRCYDVGMMVCGVFMYLLYVLRMLECYDRMLYILVVYTCMYCYIVVIRLHCIVWFTLYNCNLITAYTWL